MRKKQGEGRSVGQRVANRGRERRLTRDDAHMAYAMDRLLFRLGRSPQVGEFFLKGGLLVANLVDAPHRFTRDIDLLRRHGPADLEDIRQRFREVVAMPSRDGVLFAASEVRALIAAHDEDGYEGVKVFVGAQVGGHSLELRIDIGFGDALVPPADRVRLEPFLPDDEPASVLAYGPGPVLAEKIETLLSKFPVIRHRLKDLLDVVVLSDTLGFDGAQLRSSLRATLERRKTFADPQVLDEMHAQLVGRRWQTDWASMLKEKSVAPQLELPQALRRFDDFVRPLLLGWDPACPSPRWDPGGPWSAR